MKDRKLTRSCSGSLSNFSFMNLDLYTAVSILAVSFVHILIGSKRFLPPCLLLLFFVRHPSLEYSSSDESDNNDKEEPDEPESEYGSTGTFGSGLGG